MKKKSKEKQINRWQRLKFEIGQEMGLNNDPKTIQDKKKSK